MKFVNVTPENIATEHLCCAISDQSAQSAKKNWMEPCFADGYTFLKLDDRGKAFIEYVPAERAWCPIIAPGWLFLGCFWVSGSFAKKGVGGALLEKALQAAREQGRHGLVALSSDKKKAFLSDPKFYKKRGFTVADTAPPYYELLSLPLRDGAPPPRFTAQARRGAIADRGVVLYYTDHCPWNSKYIPLLTGIARSYGAPFDARRITTVEEAQALPNPFPTYAVFYDGEFVTNEMFSDKKFAKFLEEKGFAAQ